MTKKIFLILMFSFLYFIFYGKGEAMQLESLSGNQLKLSIKTDKESYSIGETLQISYIIENTSNKNLIFVNWNKGYKANWIKIYDKNKKELSWQKQVIYELARYLSKDSYIKIPKKDKLVLEIKGKIINDNNKIIIDFDDSSIILDGPGDYYVKGAYDSLESWRNDGKRLYSLKDVWIGKIESNEIRIEIK